MQTYTILSPSRQLPVSLQCLFLADSDRNLPNIRSWKDDLQLFYVLNGSLDLSMEPHQLSFKNNEFFLLNPGQVYQLCPKNCTILLLSFPLSFFHFHDRKELYFQCDPQQYSTPSENIRCLLAHITHACTLEEKSAFLMLHSLLLHLCHELLVNFRQKTDDISVLEETDRLRFNRLLIYLEQHYAEDISLETAASHEFLSASYLSHYFREKLGIPFTKYLTGIRLKHAADLLAHPSYSMEEIADRCGFKSARAMARFFKEQYHCLPTEYRKQLHSPSNISTGQDTSSLSKMEYTQLLAPLQPYLAKTPYIWSRSITASPAVKAVSISLQRQIGTLNRSFLTLINLGHVNNLLSSMVQEMLRVQKEEIGFQYVFIHGVFDDNIINCHRNPAGELHYTFTLLDEAFSFLVNLGLTPVIQLSWVPKALTGPSPVPLRLNHSFYDLPCSMEEWKKLVKDFITHLFWQFSSQTVSKWIFTCFNELPLPYLPEMAKNQQLYSLYLETWKTIKEVDPHIAVASPPFFCQEDVSENLRGFLIYSQQHLCFPDLYFLSVFPLQENREPDSQNQPQELHYSQLSTDPESLKHFSEKLSAFLKPLPEKPVFIVQWNCSPWHQEPLNDTCFSASYLVHNILNCGNAFGAISYIRFTDWGGNGDEHSSLFYGGNGLFTRNFLKKPNYWAYHFLSRLRPFIIAKGNGYLFTKNEQGYTAILYNYCHFSANYAKGFTFTKDSNQRYSVFPDAAPKQFHFRLKGLPKKDHVVFEYIINRQHGSVFDNWVNSGAPEPLRKPELEQLRLFAQPYIRRGQLISESGSYYYHATLQPHEIRLVEILPV